MWLPGRCCKSDGTGTVYNGLSLSSKDQTERLKHACNWPAWRFMIWRLLFSFILKMEVACSTEMSVYICQNTRCHVREDTVVFCFLRITNFITCAFNLGAEETWRLLITQAEGPATGGCPRLLTEYMYNHFPYLELLSLTRNRRTRNFVKVPLMWVGEWY